MSVLRSAGIAVVCALALCAEAPTATALSPQNAETSGCSGGADTLSFVVLFDPGTTRHDATSAIATACGSTVIYYEEIALAVASSDEADFAERIGTQRSYSAQARKRAQRDVVTAHDQASIPHDQGTRQAHARAGARRGKPWNMRAIGAARARELTHGSDDVVVAVLDSGIAAGHPALTGAVTAERSAGCVTGAPVSTRAAWSANGTTHGTHVAGIIAAGPGTMTGVAPEVRVASVRVIDEHGSATVRAVVCGLMWAAHHDMAVANSSLTLTVPPLGCGKPRQRDVALEAVTRAVRYAASRGTVTVAAATNSGWKLTPAPASTAESAAGGSCVSVPASLHHVVTVAALTPDGVKAAYSSYGLGVIDVAAPGGAPGSCVRSTVPGGYARKCGTSMAAAHASGVLALLAAEHPNYSASELADALRTQADPKPCPADYDLDGNGTQDAYCTGYAGYNGFYGYGVVNALAAYQPA